MLKKPKSWRILMSVLGGFILIAAIGLAVAGNYTRYYDGRWVQKRTVPQGSYYGLPVPGVAEEYFVYVNPADKEVKHGPDTQYFMTGQPQFLTFYRNGLPFGTSTQWQQDGKKNSENFYDNQNQVTGHSVYINGEIEYCDKPIYDSHYHIIAFKRFESGHWFMEYPVGATQHFTIDRYSGQSDVDDLPER